MFSRGKKSGRDNKNEKQFLQRFGKRELKRLASFLHASPDLLVRIDSQGNYLDYICPDDQELFIPSRKAIGRNIRDILPEDIWQREDAAIQKTLKTGRGQVYQYQLPLSFGVRHFEARTRVSGPDEVLIVVRDITREKEAREMLEKTSFLLQSIMESSSNALLAVDGDGNILFSNERAEEWFLHPRQPGDFLTGRSLGTILEDPEFSDIQFLIENIQAGDLPGAILDKRLTRGRTTAQILRMNFTALDPRRQMDGETGPSGPGEENPKKEKPGVLISCEDITHRKTLELQLLQSSKLATMGQMSSAMAHELNQPLSVIRMAAQLLAENVERKDWDTAFFENRLTKILTQVDRAADVINHLRAFSRKKDRPFRPVPPLEALSNALKLMDQQLRLRDIELIRQLPAGGTTVLTEGDLNQLEQVFLNIILNARDALCELEDDNPRKLTASASLTKDDRDQDILVIEISNNGPRIAPEHLGRVFEPFFTTKDVGQGTGLGLSISYSIIDWHNGSIEVESESRRTCFRVVLPVLPEGGAV